MDARVLILTLPSLAILGLLIYHSLRTLPRARALAFWCTVGLYGVLRGVALRWVIDHGLGASFPYVIRHPLFPVLGVPLQEIAGWAIVSYIGWWLGSRFSPKLFAQIAWACLFLGAISWTVESVAVAAGWWHWTVPVTNPLFVNVPFIGIIDWFFVGIDFLLPFVVVTAPALRGRPARFIALLAFPLHFSAHCFVGRVIESIPIPTYHLMHWILISILLWLATRSAVVDAAFASEGERWRPYLPIVGLSIILLDAAAVELLMVRRPELLLSILPAFAVALQALRPAAGYCAGAAGLLLGVWAVPFILTAVPAATASILWWARRHRRWAPAAALALLGLLAYQVHAAGARRQADLIRRLDAAIAARDRGDLETAKRELLAARRDFPGSHVPPVLLGEIHYRTEQLAEARPLFVSAIAIKQDLAEGYSYLAVIDLRLGRKESAAHFAEKGLEIDGEEPGLRYLLARATGRGIDEIRDRFERLRPQRAHSLASLAYEVGDIEGAIAMLDRGLALWPGERSFYPSRLKLALAERDEAAARRVAAAWRDRFPEDAEARQVARQLGMEE